MNGSNQYRWRYTCRIENGGCGKVWSGEQKEWTVRKAKHLAAAKERDERPKSQGTQTEKVKVLVEFEKAGCGKVLVEYEKAECAAAKETAEQKFEHFPKPKPKEKRSTQTAKPSSASADL